MLVKCVEKLILIWSGNSPPFTKGKGEFLYSQEPGIRLIQNQFMTFHTFTVCNPQGEGSTLVVYL